MTKPIVTEKELQTAREMIERARAQTSPKDQATLVAVDAFSLVVRTLPRNMQRFRRTPDSVPNGDRRLSTAYPQRRRLSV